MTTNRPLRVFLCHSSNDKPAVRELYQKLRAEPWIQPWLDEEELYPGQDWNMEIEKAVEAADAIIVCLTKNSINKEGYVQRELRIVLDFADYKPEGTVYIIPVRLEECEPPRRLRTWQYADYFEGQRDRGLKRMLVSLQKRANSLGLKTQESAPQKENSNPKFTAKSEEAKPLSIQKMPVVEISKSEFLEHPNSEWIAKNKITLSNGMELMRVPMGKFLMGDNNQYKEERPQHTIDIPYDYWMARYPITLELYTAYIKSKGIKHPSDKWVDKKEDHPIGAVTWSDTLAYSQWLNNLLISEIPSGLILRLPTEAEWEKAARGTDGREYPWGNIFNKNNCNTNGNAKTSVSLYSPQGDSPYGCADMAGNVWEWTHSRMKPYPYNFDDGREKEKDSGARVLRGGSFNYNERYARCASRQGSSIDTLLNLVGFRMVASIPFPTYDGLETP